jgi:hypothetical protein
MLDSAQDRSGAPEEGETNDRAIATPQTNQGAGGSRSAALLSGAACAERTAVLALRGGPGRGHIPTVHVGYFCGDVLPSMWPGE